MADCLLWSIAACVTAVKLLMLHAYRSTDYEVHRNWLAITASLPPQKWYYEESSEWTLDYPPFFAWFEHLLSKLAVVADPQMVSIRRFNYISNASVIFHRLSVVITDVVYIYACKEFVQKVLMPAVGSKDGNIYKDPRSIVFVLLTCNFGLFIVDHIHFQYNGFLFGILMISIVRMFQKRHLESALHFAVLLNLKHIYLYIAPAYFVYLLRVYCFDSSPEDGSVIWRSFKIRRLGALGIVVGAMFTLSFGPFVYWGQLGQVLSRLFPFKRGLCHAYWAPNFWALYNVVDKAASVVAAKMGLLPRSASAATMTGGLVQEYDHTVLPSVRPVATMAITILSMLPALVHLWKNPAGPRSFLRCLVLCACCSFAFGWHVHEKAVLLALLPLCLMAADRKQEARVFLILSAAGHVSLFPLIFTAHEQLLLHFSALLYTVYAFNSFGNLFGDRESRRKLPLLSGAETAYVLGLLPLLGYTSLVHHWLGLTERLPFLPLLLTSLYCSLGVLYAFALAYKYTLAESMVIRINRPPRRKRG